MFATFEDSVCYSKAVVYVCVGVEDISAMNVTKPGAAGVSDH